MPWASQRMVAATVGQTGAGIGERSLYRRRICTARVFPRRDRACDRRESLGQYAALRARVCIRTGSGIVVELARLAPPFAVALRERHQEPVLLRRISPLAHNVSSPQ